LATTSLAFDLGVLLSVLHLTPEPTLPFGVLPVAQRPRALQLPTEAMV
jgi:hypothetical protein